MKSCPKCGFLQPPDRFCAKCGIDTLIYIPPQKPLTEKLLSSPYLRLFIILILLLFGLQAYFNLQPQNSIPQSSESPIEISQFLPILAEQEEEPIKSPVKSQPQENAPTESVAKIENVITVDPTATKELPPEAGLTDQAVSLALDPKIFLRFIRLPQKQVEVFANRSVQKNDLNFGASSGLIRNSWLQQLKLPQLGETTTRKLLVGQELVFNEISQKREGEPNFNGLIVKIIAQSISAHGLQMTIEVNTHFNQSEAGFNLQSNSFSVQFRPNETPFVIGAFPHKIPKLFAARAFFSQGPFSIFSFDEFTKDFDESPSGQDEFVILFHVEGLQ